MESQFYLKWSHRLLPWLPFEDTIIQSDLILVTVFLEADDFQQLMKHNHKIQHCIELKFCVSTVNATLSGK